MFQEISSGLPQFGLVLLTAIGSIAGHPAWILVPACALGLMIAAMSSLAKRSGAQLRTCGNARQINCLSRLVLNSVLAAGLAFLSGCILGGSID